MLKRIDKPRIGVLLITTPRFRNLGEGTEGGVYHERKRLEAERLIVRLGFAQVIYPGVVYDRDDIRAAMERFSMEKADMVLTSFLSWSDDFAWIRFLRDMPPIPVFFACFTRDTPGFADSLNEDRFVEFLSAGGLVGALEASGSLTRLDRPMLKRALGHIDELLPEIESFARAARLRNMLKDAVFGLLPSYNEVMWGTYIDPYLLFAKAGPELRFLSIAELMEYIEKTPAEDVECAVETLLSAYETRGEFSREKLFASVEASLALERLARDNGVSLLVLNDVDRMLFERVGLRPGFTPCPGTDDLAVVPEGDLGGGLAAYVLSRLSGGHVGYIEPFCIDRRNDTFYAGHAGPNDYTDPAGRTLISKDTRFEKSGYKHAGAPFAWHRFGPGERTMLHFSQSGQTLKLVCSVVDAIDGEHFLDGYSHGVFKARIPASEFFEKLINIGVTQHYCIAAGDFTSELESLAFLMGFDFYRI